MYMDNIKLFAKNEKELETLTQTIRMYSQDTGMDFSIEKCALLILRSGKRIGRNRTAKPRNNQNTWRKGKLQVLGNTGSGHHQTSGDKNKEEISTSDER